MKKEMTAAVTLGNGDYEQISIEKRPIPKPEKGEVLIRVLAAGINNTEINTRLGWYSSSVSGSTETLEEQTVGESHKKDGGWGTPTPFPLIQGTDCCGEVIETGSEKDNHLVRKRVLVRPCMVSQTHEGYTPWFGSDFHGAFAQYTIAPASEVFTIDTNWSDVELASIPCAYGTAENLVQHLELKKGDKVLITGASGGVGSAAVQLAQLRGAEVFGVSGQSKAEQVKALGANVIVRGSDYTEALGAESVDGVIDLVGGESFPQLLEVLKRSGKYVTSGAIGGPVVGLDLRKLYLKDLRLIGCTAWGASVFSDLVGYIETGKIKPLIWKTYPLVEIVEAQKEFLRKQHFGKMVLIPNS